MSILIEQATKADIESCAKILANAFKGDLVVADIVPGKHNRVQRLTIMFSAIMRTTALHNGVIDIAREAADKPIIGVAIWENPEKSTNLWAEIREIPNFLKAIGIRNIVSALSVLKIFKKYRPSEKHWYLSDIAVSPDARGLGVGSALLEYRLNKIDKTALPAYLESTTDSNRRLYERYGFKKVDTIELTTVNASAMLRFENT
ncbi:MAG: GNAT family N-acetyltransferase [Micrococcaceae bacterium]